MRPRPDGLLETPDGTLAYRRAGTGDPLVLLHGGLSDSRSWTPQLQSLSTEYDVVAWDSPGCGGSADLGGEPALAGYADAVAGLVDALGLGPVHLAGHSFGSGLALEVYGRHPRLVRSLVLSGPYAGWRGSLAPTEVEARRTRALADVARPPAEWAGGYLDTFFSAAVPADTRELARTMLLDVRPEGAVAMVTAFADADLRAVLPTVTVPTLLVRGSVDERSSQRVAEVLRAAIPGSRLVVVDGAGHDVNLEAPQEYDAAVRTFLRTVTGAPAG